MDSIVRDERVEKLHSGRLLSAQYTRLRVALGTLAVAYWKSDLCIVHGKSGHVVSG